MKSSLGNFRFAFSSALSSFWLPTFDRPASSQHVENSGQTAMDQVPETQHTGALNKTCSRTRPHRPDGSHRQRNQLPRRPGMPNTPNVYIIWYGNWNGTGSNTAATRGVIEHFFSTIGGSAIELVNSTYGDNTNNVTGNVHFGGSTIVSSTKNLTDRSLQTTVSNALNNGRLPRDANGVYFVISSSNINETSGFCTQYCGFHTRATLGGTDIKYAFVGNVDRCPSGCEAQTTGPNSPVTGQGGIDGMANVLSHELEEAISDPDLNAWFDASGQENADKCNFNFGAVSTCTTVPLHSGSHRSRIQVQPELWRQQLDPAAKLA